MNRAGSRALRQKFAELAEKMRHAGAKQFAMRPLAANPQPPIPGPVLESQA
jgi:hypothetical protein